MKRQQECISTEIKGKAIVITIPFQALETATENHKNLCQWESKGVLLRPRVADMYVFSKEVLAVLKEGDEYGEDPVSSLLNNAIETAFEFGAEGIIAPADEGYKK